MKVDYIALSIPIFFLLIGIELIIAFVTKRKLYRFNDSITNISLGIGQQVTGIFMKTVLFYAYLFIYEHKRFFTVESSLLNWVLLFFAVDFFYYWFHRLSHEINAMWAAHIVHHQSEEYNLSVALRQSWFQSAFSWVFYLPLALVGFDPVMFLTISSFNTLYQFWIHTRTIKRMGVLEWFLNTPSHHRVHHGTNPKYIDKNHAGTLIIWDRLFGTFQQEEEEPYYGITKPLESWNPLWANFHYWEELIQKAKQSSSWKNKIKLFLKPPAWEHGDSKNQEISNQKIQPLGAKYDQSPSQKKWNIYILFLFLTCLLVATLLLFQQKMLSNFELLVASVFSILSLINCGGILEKKQWVYASEILRIAFLFIGVLVFYEQPSFKLIFMTSLSVGTLSLLFFLILNRSPFKKTNK